MNMCENWSHGRELRAPLQIEIEGEKETLVQPEHLRDPRAYTLYRSFRDILQQARKNASLDFLAMENASNQKPGQSFEKGEHCLLLVHNPQMKFSKRWAGPYEIIKKCDQHLYVIATEKGEHVTNISKMKKYTPRNKSQNQDLTDPATEDPSLTTTNMLLQPSDNLQTSEPTRPLRIKKGISRYGIN